MMLADAPVSLETPAEFQEPVFWYWPGATIGTCAFAPDVECCSFISHEEAVLARVKGLVRGGGDSPASETLSHALEYAREHGNRWFLVIDSDDNEIDRYAVQHD